MAELSEAGLAAKSSDRLLQVLDAFRAERLVQPSLSGTARRRSR
jgi:hypothetical protein